MQKRKSKAVAYIAASARSIPEPVWELACWFTQSYLPPGRGSVSRPYPGRYSIYPLIKNERLSRPELTQVNDLPRVATEVPAIPRVIWLCWPSAPLGTVDVNN